MRERNLLQDRIILLGSVKHEEVRSVLVRGSIFLNTSLTEAFGIGILEAACTGLYVVSTKVGGVPEVLPTDMISFANPDEDGECSFDQQRGCSDSVLGADLHEAVSKAIDIVSTGKHDPWQAHHRIAGMYSWEHVARRTEVVYQDVLKSSSYSLWERMQRYALRELSKSISCSTFDHAIGHWRSDPWQG